MELGALELRNRHLEQGVKYLILIVYDRFGEHIIVVSNYAMKLP